MKWTSERHANHYSHAQSLVSSGHAYGPLLLSSKGLSLPVSYDENAYHVVPWNPYLVPPTPSKNKLNPSTKKLYGCDPVLPDLTASHLCQDKSWLAKRTGPVAKKTCRACAAPNRYFIYCHELLPKFLSKLTCQLMSSGNLTYFRRLYLMCLSTCSMKPIILLTVGTILLNQWSQPTKMHLATQSPWFQFPLIKFLVLSQKVEP